MRYRLMATYRGVPYEAGVGPTDSDIVLFAACPPPEDLGFQPATGHWRKPVNRAEVDAMWESRPQGLYRGEPCLVLDDLGEQLHISYTGNDPSQAEQLGYCQMEPGVYEVLVPREEVTGITEERVERPYPISTAPWLSTSTPAPPPPWADWTADGGNGTAAPPIPAGPTSAAPADSATADALAPPAPVTPPLVTPSPVTPALVIPAPVTPVTPPPASLGPASLGPASLGPPPRGRHGGTGARPRTRETFSELVGLASLPQDSYAVDEVVEGAICLVRTDRGFEVFIAADGTRHEVRLFADEEAAYFYLFGLLAAEAVRDGRLMPARG
ncbi:MAG TPA: hypothetical protein VKS82_13330 [Streptosporangiaceae bacterium]|nr:hypothetical protein [Streptosporangiaceae bacterium]